MRWSCSPQPRIVRLAMMEVTETTIKTALVRSRIPGVQFVINPYLGCSHGCSYCYAAFMRKFSRRHFNLPWGTFVEAKVNIAEVLRRELSRRKKPSTAMLSSVCDPYQPAEKQYRLTRQCLEALMEYGWNIEILTRSPLVLRDLDILSSSQETSVGITLPTDNDEVRRILEPNAPSIGSRIEAIKRLSEAGLHTWAFVGPLLPMDPQALFNQVFPYVDHILIDALNYREKVRNIFHQHHWEYALTDEFADRTAAQLTALFGGKACRV